MKIVTLKNESVRAAIQRVTGEDIGEVRLNEALTQCRGAMRMRQMQVENAQCLVKGEAVGPAFNSNWQQIGFFAPPANEQFTPMMIAGEN